MNQRALMNDLNKAIALVARRHEAAFNIDTNSTTDAGVSLTLTIGETVSPHYSAYLLHKTQQDDAGHNAFKRRYGDLSDEMRGQVFTVSGKEYVYVGCRANQPSYPVTALRVEKFGGYTELKCGVQFLTAMINQLKAEQKKRDEAESIRRTKKALSDVDPDLADSAEFA